MATKTKIVGTIGPASREPGTLTRLIEAGLDVCRLNFSHGDHAGHAAAIRDIRAVAARLGAQVAVLQDLAGPKIRTGDLADGPVRLEPGAPFVLTSRDVPGDAEAVGLTYAELPAAVHAGDTILLADGALQLAVEAVDATDIACRVVVGGELGAHKGINLPGRTLGTPALTPKDEEDLAFGLAQDVDFVALSFVRRAADVRAAKDRIRAAGKDTPLIAKIEKFEALDDLEGIVAEADGLMVARGDLGVEIPLEQVPRAQKRIIALANAAAKPVITATQMLKSMVDSPRPTRAEVADVANAIYDGTDAVMLSEETAVGRYPVGAVEVMTRVATEVEADFDHDAWLQRTAPDSKLSYDAAVARAAVEMARDIGATAILTCTDSGSTTRLVARHRPPQPILALTPHRRTALRLALVHGAVPLLVDAVTEAGEMERVALAAAREAGYVVSGRPVVITAGLPLNVAGTTNLIKVATA